MRKWQKFYNKNKALVWIVAGIIVLMAAFVLGGFTFGVFGGWSPRPI